MKILKKELKRFGTRKTNKLKRQMTGLSILSYIYENLINNQELNRFVKKQIFPLVSEESVKDNYIILTKTNVNPTYNKDCCIDNVNYSVTIYSKNYKTTIQIAEIVREILEKLNQKLDAVSENFQNDLYYQQLNFSTRYIMN